jgi:hypothetical protein
VNLQSDEEVFINFLENLAIVVLRKLDFFNIYMRNLAEEVGEDEADRVEPEILKFISSMDPIFFLTKRELDMGKIIASSELKDIDRKKIGELIADSLRL